MIKIIIRNLLSLSSKKDKCLKNKELGDRGNGVDIDREEGL
jgi:hypothetical protein